MRVLFCVVGLVVSMAPMVANSATITVCPAGCDETSVVAAVSAAMAGDSVFIHPGTYQESSTIAVDKTLTIQGSGAGVTVIETTSPGPVITTTSTAPHGFFYLEDLTISGGYSTGTQGNGGGLSIIGSSLGQIEIRNCEIVGNSAEVFGGGIYVQATGFSLVIDSCTIARNSANYGAGVYVFANDLSLTIDSSVFEKNVAAFGGGGILLDVRQRSKIAISASEILGNQAGFHGGGFLLSTRESGFSITSSTISDNTSVWSGGGAYIYSTVDENSIESTVIRNNHSSSYGGGVYFSEGSAQVHYSLIASNSASSGGGIWVGSSAVLKIFNSTVAFNRAQNGDAGGIGNRNVLHVIGCTVAENTSSTGWSLGIKNSGSAMLGSNIISNPGGNNCSGDFGYSTFNIDDDGTCDLPPAGWNISGQSPGLGPFVDTGDHRSHFPLLSNSIAIDYSYHPDVGGFDQLGTPRPQDGDGDGVAVNDVGAVERETPLFADGFESGDTSAWSAMAP